VGGLAAVPCPGHGRGVAGGEDGITGYLVPPGDAAQFGAALSRAVHERDTSAAMGRAARQFVLPRFGVDQYVNSVSALYHRFLTAKGLA
jgi:glycosyltransferase involved in cell wall biosynthesis